MLSSDLITKERLSQTHQPLKDLKHDSLHKQFLILSGKLINLELTHAGLSVILCIISLVNKGCN